MKQKTATVHLQTIVKFANENGYRIIVKCLRYNESYQQDWGFTIKEILEIQPKLLVRCTVIECGLDFRRAISLGGCYKFLLIS